MENKETVFNTEIDKLIDSMDLTKEPPIKEPERQYWFMKKARPAGPGKGERAGTATDGLHGDIWLSDEFAGLGKTCRCAGAYRLCGDRRRKRGFCHLQYLFGPGKTPIKEFMEDWAISTGLKKKNPHMMIALCGCMMQEPQVVEKLKKSYSFVNLIFGTHNIYKFAELVVSALLSDRMVIDIWKDTDKIVEDLPVERKYPFKSGVNIMFGCNNFCSYCIVPYVRGRERSRNPKDIIREIERLVADGVVEVMLLGQNVNSYGKNLEEPMTFAQLLQEVEKIQGLERIRFMTSHPKDLSDELIEVMKNSKKICRHIHLPLQSGSSRILKLMNRRYDKEKYLDLVRKIREAMPDISLTTDIIVGFPGETEEDFLETMDVVEKVRYDSAFTFIYSKRTGTPAAVMEDQVPEDVVKDRF